MVIRVNKTFGHISYMDSSQHHILVVFLGLFYLVVTTDMFFSLLKQKTATVGPFEEGRGAMKKNCVARLSKENMSQVHDFGNFWCDLGTFWSDLRMQLRITLCN